MNDEQPPLIARGITKRFPGVVALDDVHCTLHAGEVLAIVGENGAGKSTLMKIIAGVYQPDGGQLTWRGQAVHFGSPLQAMQAGVSLIHQELNLAENLTILDNLFLGRELTVGGPLLFLNTLAMEQRGKELLQLVGLPLEYLHRVVGDLAPGQKQMVEIARALGADAKLLIMDEPTSSLTQKETDRLYQVIADVKARGVAVMYISHRLAEIKRCCDRAVVLRDGKNSGELAKADINHENLVRMMVGRDLKQFFPRTRVDVSADAAARLQVRGVVYQSGPREPASFDLRAGEVLGMSGLVGAGRTELAEAIFGLRKQLAGDVILDGQPLRIRKPADAIRAGLLLLPEDRRHHGLVLESSVGFNLSLTNLDQLSRMSIVQPGKEQAFHKKWIERLLIKTPSAEQTIGLLSGGNQQKGVFGKWLARNPKVLILDEPTRGVDVRAKAEIYALIDEMAGQGLAVLMITSDLEELLGVADRVVVMHEGRIAGELNRTEMTEEAVMHLATGGTTTP